jgi:hypothetical protein
MNKNNTTTPILIWRLVIWLCCFNTALWAAEITPVNNGSWQDQSTWPGGQFPGASDDVIIPAGFLIDLTGNIEVKSITINGTLRAVKDASIDLKVEWIMVRGDDALFEIGTADEPFNGGQSCVITLVGVNDGDQIMSMGDKLIGAMDGANIEFHGQQKVSWSHLGSNINSGSNQITMASAVDWVVGDEIVIVSSRPDWEEAEKRTIAAISGDGLTITLNSSLNYPHVGSVETYTRSTDNKTWTADLRAEVGLLTRNVKIQGDAGSESGGYGGHIMAMNNSTINGSNIELYRMGQKAILARYPWHWHLLHEFGEGQYLKNSSIHRSFNRAVTIHGTSYVNVENNFFYDHIGHGIFLEDGSERYNTIINNVVLLTKRPKEGEELTPSDNELDQVQNRTPSSFWITNPNNTFEGNVAAGTQGTGYWFALPQSPMGLSAGDSRYDGIEPFKEPLGSFKNNKAHSCRSGFDIFDQLKADHSLRTNAGWQNSEEHLIEDCTWYANDLALYTGIGGGVGDKVTYAGNLIFWNNVVVDNVTAMQFASYSQVKESVFVADSGNDILPGATSLYRIYDGAGQIHDSHLVGWNGDRVDYLKDGGAATKHTNHRISGITTDDGMPPVVNLRDYDIPMKNNDDTPQSISHPRVWNIVLYDEDGSFSGRPESSIVSNHPMMLVGDEFQHDNWVNAYRSPHKFALVILQFDGINRFDSPNVTCTRTKTGTPTESYYDMYGYKDHIMTPVIVRENFMYTYTFESLPAGKNVSVILDDATVGDDAILRFTDFGKQGGLSLSESGVALPNVSSLGDLENISSTAYYVEANGDLYVKYVATKFLQDIDINWNTDFEVPMLDTDGDGVSDRDEIIAGSDPYSDAAPDPAPNLLVWDFDKDVEGWTGNPHNLSVSWNSNGYLDCVPSGSDPYVFNDNLQGFDTDRINYLEVRVKNGTSHTVGALYVFTASSGTFPITFAMTPNATEFETILVDLSTVSGWTNNLRVNRLRIDPNGNGAGGTISFDHIYLMQTDSLDLDLTNTNFTIEAIGETCADAKNGSIVISAENTLSYSVRLNESESYDFTSDLTIDDLAPGDYSICITVSEIPDYEQCFNLTIAASEEISGKSVRTKSGDTFTETVDITSGTAPYTVAINGEALFSTYERNFSVDVNHGDKISVSSKFECEGILYSDVNLIDQFTASPNPTTDYVDILVPTIQKQEISVTVYTSLQQRVLVKNCTVQNGRIRVPLEDLPHGLYFVTLNLETPVNFKILKQ